MNQALDKNIDTSWHPLVDGNPPKWASAWGQDNFGVWVEFMIGKVTQKLRWIPAGVFAMGSLENEVGRFDNEGPQRQVIIEQGYWLFDTPVTQVLWHEVMGENPSEFKSPERPVDTVSWDDCEKFLDSINDKIPGLKLSLPSEAQWEYACRAGTKTALYNGEIEIIGDANAPALHSIAWYGGNSGLAFDLENGHEISYLKNRQFKDNPSGTHPVALKLPNDWGLYDMLGNVWEWTDDHWQENYNKAPIDGSAWLDKDAKAVALRVLRGGSWYDGARLCRSAARSRIRPDGRNDGIGFRCARVQAR